MPIFKLLCRECGRVFEKLVYSKTSVLSCECGSGEVEKMPTVAAFKIDNTPKVEPDLDRKVGADAEKRWRRYEERGAKLDKVKKSLREGESVGLDQVTGEYVAVEKGDADRMAKERTFAAEGKP